MLKQLRRSGLAGVSLWQDHWRQFADIRFDRESIRWDGFVDLVDARIGHGPILEAGCGLGRYLLYLRGRGARAAGVDFAAEPLQAIRHAVGPAPVAVADLVALPFPTGMFATILCLGVVEHFESGAAPALREMARVLRPGGELIVTVPYANGLKRWQAGRHGRNVVPATRPTPAGWNFYQFCFAEPEVRRLIESAGLEVGEVRKIGKLFSLVGMRRQRPAPTGAKAPRAGATGVSEPRRTVRTLIKEAAFYGQAALPGVLLAHMILVVGRKPGRR